MTTHRETGDFCINQMLLLFLETIPNPKASVMVSCGLDILFLLSGLLPETCVEVQTHLSSLIHLQVKMKKSTMHCYQGTNLIHLAMLLKYLMALV